ncbi:hypothetical protein RHOSPDRAFT_31437 [Rhodotorula sp. JG-1b]|nr:hypothetical protein RHOSPDRAFT_31437 [Rhodotorula sp. JG-1b]
MGASILCVTVAGVLVALACSSYTLLRSLLPLLLAPQPTPAPTTIQSRRPRLKSAQQFTVLLSLADIAAVTILLWEVVGSFSSQKALAGTRFARSGIILATTARPTLLLSIACLSYLNVVRGRQVPLRKWSSVVWVPALGLCAGGAGFAALAPEGSRTVWIALATWLTIITSLTTASFGRLLLAILRVRRQSSSDQHSQGQSSSFSQTSHPDTSSLSTSLVHSIGRSTSTLSLPLSPVPEPQSRLSTAEFFARSPIPGSCHNLIDRSTTSLPPHSIIQLGPRLNREAHEVLTLEESPLSGPAEPSPRSSSAPAVELSAREARGALIRIGGHLVSALASYALVAPFTLDRCLQAGSASSHELVYALFIGVCLPSGILAWQSAASDGFWVPSVTPTPSEVATVDEIDPSDYTVNAHEGFQSQEPSWRVHGDCAEIGIQPDGVMSSPTRRGSFGRAISMLSTHPKLQLLPQHTRTISRSTALRPSASHARLRSLHLPGLVSALPASDAQLPIPRCATPATIAGHQVATPIPKPATKQEIQVAQSLLNSRKTRSMLLERSGSVHACPTFQTRPEHAEFGLLPHNSPAEEVSTDSARKKVPSIPVEIDFLAAQMLPKLVPSIKVGANVKITTASMSRRPSFPLQPANQAAGDLDERPVQGTKRRFSTLRNHSLPTLSFMMRLPSGPLDLDPPCTRREASPERVVREEDGGSSSADTADTDSLAELSVSGFVLLPTPSEYGEDSSSSSSEEEDDPRTGTIHCATLCPVSRSSSASVLLDLKQQQQH